MKGTLRYNIDPFDEYTNEEVHEAYEWVFNYLGLLDRKMNE